MITRSSLLLICLILSLSACTHSAKKEAGQCGKNEKIISDTLPWSQRMGETVLLLMPILRDNENEAKWSYTSGLLCLSIQKLYEKYPEERYHQYVQKYVDTIIQENGVIYRYKTYSYNLDNVNSGKLLFKIFEETKEEKYKKAMDTLRNQFKGQPRVAEGGFWHKKKYPHQMWLDGLYMGAPFYAQYGKVFNEPEIFDDVALQILLIEKKTRDEKTGLLYHGWDESKEQKWANPETGCSPHFWGRGMGWYAMAIVDALDFIPENHPKRNDIIAVLNRLVDAILKVQDKETGTWYQVLDQRTREGNYLESSATTMFTYTMLKAINKGYIDKSYLKSAEKAYKGIIENMIKVEDDGSLVILQACTGAGLGGKPDNYRDGSYDYYVNQATKGDNNHHAIGPFILASLEYEILMDK